MNVTNEEYPKEVLRELDELRKRAELTDVVLEVEGRSFPCHRAVLASCSPYFRGMFTSGYAEAEQERISIQDVSEVAMATILDYAYTGCLQTEPDQVLAVMSAARLLQAAEYMKAHLDVSNCAADMLGDLGLQETSGNFIASREEYPKEVLSGLNTLREREKLTDMVLEVEGRSFPCHRAVLASCSPYFRGMFTSGYAEAKQESISIQDVSEVAMATILDYAYTGCLQMEPDQVQAVMSAARLLQVEFVCCKAAEYMKDHLDVSNCAYVLMYADMLGDLGLQKTSVKFLASRFNQVALQPSFLQLSLPLLQSLLNRDDLMVDSEDVIVQAALRWIEFNQEERLQHLPALCRSFRHSLISFKQCVELQSKCMSKEFKLVYSDSKTQRLGQMQTEMTIIVGDNFFNFFNTSYERNEVCYDPVKGKLYAMNMPDKLGPFSVAVTPTDDLYLAGHILRVINGVKDKQTAFFQFNHRKNVWESRCDLTSPRVSCGLVHLNGYIYAIGGDDTNRTAERYDPSHDEWTSIPSIPYPMPVQPTFHPDPEWSSVLCAVSLDDSVYIITSKGCYSFSTTENKWNKTADMLKPPRHPQAIAYQGRIYCVDRKSPSPYYVQVYDPEDNVWKHSGNGTDTGFPGDDLILMPHGGSLHLLTLHKKGKRDVTNAYGQTVKRYSEIDLFQYQPETDTWLKPQSTGMKLDPMIRWFQSAHRKDCLVARMVPKWLGYIEDSDDGEEEGFEDGDEMYGHFSDYGYGGDFWDELRESDEDSYTDEDDYDDEEDFEDEEDDYED